MDLYDVAIARKLSSGGGGGGSSDFSTATVTITNSASVRVYIYVPAIFAFDEGDAFAAKFPLSPNKATQATVVLYNGSVMFFTDEGRTLSVTGDIELPPFPVPVCTITGDGTITIS